MGDRQISMKNVPSVRERKEAGTGMYKFAQNLRSQVQRVVNWVKQSNDKYHENMARRTAGKPVRKFIVGDEVTKFKSSRSKKKDETSSKQEGPFRVTAVHESGVTYITKKIGSDNREVKAHVNNLKAYRRFSEYKGEIPAVQEKRAATKHAKQYIVEAITGERESEEGQKQFLIKWKEHTEHTWEPGDNLHCSELVREWTKLSRAHQTTRYIRANRRGIVATVSDARTEEEEMLCALISSKNFTRMDLSKVDDALEATCKAAGIMMSEVAAVLLSLPCETYSAADCNNISRGNNYRQHDDPLKPPRKIKRGDSRAAKRKAAKAELHDRMIKKLTSSLVARREDFGFGIVLENPRGSLHHRPFMKAAAWPPRG